MSTNDQSFINMARILGYLGLAPVTLGLCGLFLLNNAELETLIVNGIAVYGALILVFVSAIHWGVALKQDTTRLPWQLLIAILPTIIAWIALLVSVRIGLALLFIGFIVWHRYETSIDNLLHFPDWFLNLRKQLSYTLAALLLLSWLMILDYPG